MVLETRIQILQFDAVDIYFKLHKVLKKNKHPMLLLQFFYQLSRGHQQYPFKKAIFFVYLLNILNQDSLLYSCVISIRSRFKTLNLHVYAVQK